MEEVTRFLDQSSGNSFQSELLWFHYFLQLSVLSIIYETMSWFAKLSKADQAGFRMFKCIMTGAAIGIVGREMYIRAIWVSASCLLLHSVMCYKTAISRLRCDVLWCTLHDIAIVNTIVYV
jgi:hypothetical protein